MEWGMQYIVFQIQEPGVQVRSFDMNENTYVDSSLQQVSQNNCECVLAVYTCGQLGTTASGEEN